MPVDFIEDVQKPSGGIDFLPDEPAEPLNEQAVKRLQQSAGVDEMRRRYLQAEEESKAAAPGLLNLPLSALSTPLFHPKTSEADLEFRRRHPIIGGIEKGIVSLAEGFTSPVGVATLGIGALPQQAQRAVAAGFAAQMASQVPEVAGQLGEEFGKPPAQRDTQKIAALITEGVGTLGMVAAAGKKGIAEPIAERIQPAGQWQGPLPTGELLQLPGRELPPQWSTGEFQGPQPLPRGKPVVPETPAEPRESSVDTIRRTGAKTISQIQQLFPQAELNRESARELRNLAWGTQPAGETYASEISRPTPIPELEVRPQVGQETPLRYEGEVTGARAEELGRGPEAEAIPQPKPQAVAPEELLSPEEQASVQAELARTQEEAPALPAATTAEILGEKPTVAEVPPEVELSEAQKVQKYSAAMVPSAGQYIRREIDSGKTPKEAALAWAKEIGSGLMDTPDDVYRKERGGLYTSTYVKGVFGTKEGVAVNAKEYFKAIDDARNRAIQRFKKPTPSPTPPPAPAAEMPAEKELWQMTRAEFDENSTLKPSGKDSNLIDPNGKKWLVPGTRSRSAALDSVHKNNVAFALGQGKPVPPEVLSDYPDLAKQAATEPEAKPLPELVSDALARSDKDAGWVWMQATPEQKSAVDKWLVDTKHPMAMEPGTAEGRFKRLVQENLPKPAVKTTAVIRGKTGKSLGAKATVETAGVKPESPTSPSSVLSTAKTLQINAPEGATQIRITDKSGRVAIAPIATLQKSNTFRGVDIAKVEAGIIGKDKKFKPVAGELTISPGGMGGAAFGETESAPGADIYGIAQRVRESRAKAGVTLPIEPGQGVGAVEAIEHGREVLSKDPQSAQKAVNEFNRSKGVSYDGMSATRAKGEETAQAARRIEEKFGTDSPEYRTAFEAAYQWDKASKLMQTEWGKTGRAQQGETDIDTGSVTGMQLAHKTATGKDFTPQQMATAKTLSEKVKVAAAIADTARQKLYEQMELALQGIDVAPPKDLTEARMLFAKFAEGNALTPQQVKTLWNAAKKFYLDSGETDFDTIRHGLATDFGISVKTVTQGLSMPRGARRISNEMYAKMAERRRVISQARNWVKDQQIPGWLRVVRTIPRVFFVDKIFGHGTVGMITHAGLNIFNPGAWKTYWPAFIKQYGLVFKPSYHERMMQDLVRDPNYITARRAGLANDPFRYTDDYQNATMRLFMGKLGGLIGGRGFDSLKLFRQARFNQIWSDLPETTRTPDMAKLVADGVNHATGVVRMPFREWTGWAFFAPKLEGSRWAWMFADPAKAAKIFKEWHNATPEEKAFAISEVKQKAAVAGTYFGLLALNQGLLSATGSDQRINVTEPKKGDFMAFKVAGHNLGVVGPMLGMVRLLANLIHDSIGKRGQVEALSPRGQEFGETVGSYARGKLSPFAGQAYNLAAQSDFQGRPLPYSSDKVPAYLRKRGIGKYTYGEYAVQELSPIPVEEAIREVWADQGMNESQINTYLKALIIGATTGGTGARISRDYPATPRVATPNYFQIPQPTQPSPLGE